MVQEIEYFRNRVFPKSYARLVWGCNWTTFCSMPVCHNLYQKLVFCWHVFWQMHKLQIHKLVSRHDYLNISTVYSVFDSKVFEIISYRQAFLESTKISASEEPNALEKVPLQFMPLQKLSGKCHFFVWFCTSNWSETYLNFLVLGLVAEFIGTTLKILKINQKNVYYYKYSEIQWSYHQVVHLKLIVWIYTIDAGYCTHAYQRCAA